MEKESEMRLSQEIKSKMSTLVFHLLFNHLKTSTKKMAFNVLCWDIPCMSKFGIIFFIRGLGQYPGNKEGVRCPYPDCKCQFYKLSNPNPNCIYLTMEEINLPEKRKQEDEDVGI